MLETAYLEETSTILDKLRDIDGYRTVLESLIDESEQNEVEQLRKKYPEDDNPEFWAYFYPIHWQDTFRPQFRFSWFVWLVSYVEFAVETICVDAEFVTQTSTKWNDFKKTQRGSLIAKASQYLAQTPLSFSLPTKREWDWLKNLYLLRNAIVHNQGFVSGVDNKTRNIAAQMKILAGNSEQIEINSEFCSEIIEKMVSFLSALCDEQSKLCKRLSEIT